MSAAAEPLPSSSLADAEAEATALPSEWPFELSREWALGGSNGAGVRVCVLDSGVDASHPMVGPLERAVKVTPADETTAQVEEDGEGDVYGHGTACAGIVRSLAPGCAISSVRVLGPANRGSAGIMLAGLRWAIDQGYDVVNLSLSTTRREIAGLMHEMADDAYFRRAVLVASAHNLAVESYPWRFSSVISVGSHDRPDPLALYCNPEPPVEFFARGADLEVAWLDGKTVKTLGNSFATAHVSGICALILAKHPELTPFELKSVLRLTAGNVARPAPDREATGG